MSRYIAFLALPSDHYEWQSAPSASVGNSTARPSIVLTLLEGSLLARPLLL